MYQTVSLFVCLFANSFNAKGKCKLFHQKFHLPYQNSSFAIFRQFRFIKISYSQHSLYARVKICVMTYLNVEGQGQIDIPKIAIFSICY